MVFLLGVDIARLNWPAWLSIEKVVTSRSNSYITWVFRLRIVAPPCFPDDSYHPASRMRSNYTEGKLLLGNRVCHWTINVPDVELTRDYWGRLLLRLLDASSYITFTALFQPLPITFTTYVYSFSYIIADPTQNTQVFRVISSTSLKGSIKKK